MTFTDADVRHRSFLFPFASDFCIWFSFLKGIKPDLPQVCTPVKLGYLSRSHCLAGELTRWMSRARGPQRKAAASQDIRDMNGHLSSAFLLNTKDHHVPVLRNSNTVTFFINKWGGVKSAHLARKKDSWVSHEITQIASDKQITSLRQCFWSRFSGSFLKLISPYQMRWSLLHVLKPVLKKCLIKHLINAFLPALLLLRRLRKIRWKAPGLPQPRWDGSTFWLIPFLNYKYYELRPVLKEFHLISSLELWSFVPCYLDVGCLLKPENFLSSSERYL